MLNIESLTLQRGGQAVLAGVDLHLPKGEFLALIGPNGAGKTSLLRAICDQLPVDQGHIRIDGLTADRDPVAYRQRFGLALAPDELPADLSPRQWLQLIAAARDLPELPAEVLDLAVDLGLGEWLDRALGRCSLGARQKTGVLTAVVGSPPLLLLDEPFNGLDPIAAFALKQRLRQWADTGRCSILLATHNLELAERWLDGAALLLGGRIVQRWDAAELHELQASGGLELAMVERLRATQAAPGGPSP